MCPERTPLRTIPTAPEPMAVGRPGGSKMSAHPRCGFVDLQTWQRCSLTGKRFEHTLCRSFNASFYKNAQQNTSTMMWFCYEDNNLYSSASLEFWSSGVLRSSFQNKTICRELNKNLYHGTSQSKQNSFDQWLFSSPWIIGKCDCSAMLIADQANL